MATEEDSDINSEDDELEDEKEEEFENDEPAAVSWGQLLFIIGAGGYFVGMAEDAYWMSFVSFLLSCFGAYLWVSPPNASIFGRVLALIFHHLLLVAFLFKWSFSPYRIGFLADNSEADVRKAGMRMIFSFIMFVLLVGTEIWVWRSGYWGRIRSWSKK